MSAHGPANELVAEKDSRDISMSEVSLLLDLEKFCCILLYFKVMSRLSIASSKLTDIQEAHGTV